MYSKRRGICPTSPPFSSRSPQDYVPIVGQERIDKLQEVVSKVQGIKILELNSTPIGGGVAEMLPSYVSLLKGMGIDIEWKVIRGSQSFFEVTKTIHNLLQGKGGLLTHEMEKIYFSTLKQNAEANPINYEPDVIMVHDPQPLGLSPILYERRKKKGKWFWRCHIDMDEETLRGQPDLENFLNYWLGHYDAAIFTAAHYVISRWNFPKFIIPPFIDPLSEKNRELTKDEMQKVLQKYHIDPEIPIISQIGRFDPWKGLMRTIQAYKLAKEKVRCQLILAGGSAPDDPEGEGVVAQIYEIVKGDPYVHILHLPSTSYLEINALQRASQVIIQPSIKEGFGLTITEALWKGKPVIASPVGGIPVQLRDGETGYLCDNPQDIAENIIYLLTHPQAAELMGGRGRDYVMNHFLLPDRATDYLRAIRMIVEDGLDPESIISFHPWFKLSKRK
jgi:trehalose synthase